MYQKSVANCFSCFRLLKESGGLTVGFNSVMRGVDKNTLSVVIFMTRSGTSSMYHALSLKCKGRDVLLLQLQDLNAFLHRNKIPISTSYGIKVISLNIF